MLVGMLRATPAFNPVVNPSLVVPADNPRREVPIKIARHSVFHS